MKLGDKVRVEFIGEITQVNTNAWGDATAWVKIDGHNTTINIPFGAMQLIESSEVELDTPIVAPDGSC